MDSNTTVISLLTISGETEQVIFAHCKQVEEIAPVSIYWYKNTLIEGNPVQYNGFVKANEQFKNENEICIRNVDGSIELGSGHIESSGRWLIKLSSATSKGQFDLS